jgi:8-oxo-dGTP pyrophosphatase MutT (NUDIX family)
VPPGDLDRIRAALAGQEPARRHPLPEGASAVLLPLVSSPGGDGPAVLFTRRSAGLTSHAGQISFPGGRIGPEDKGPVDAALRETEEEVGIAPRNVEVLGHLDDYVTYYGRLVCTYVGVVRAGSPAPRIASPEEVAEVLVVPLARFLDASIYEARALPGSTRSDRVVHYWQVRPDATIWGITAELLAKFLARVHGWEPPKEPRFISTPEEFRTGM